MAELPTLETLTALDGTPLALRRWPTPAGAPRGRVVLVHGLGEHTGRYGHVADWFRGQGWEFLGADLRGHGLSGGPRGAVRRPDDHLRDLVTVLDEVTRPRPGFPPTEGAGHIDATPTGAAPGGATPGGAVTAHRPTLLLGHSLGGLLAALFVARAVRPVDGLILSSPAFDAGLGIGKRILLAVGHTFVPDFAQPNRLDVERISRDPEVVRAYRADPLVHARVTPRLARMAVDGGGEVLARAAGWQVPTLLLWAGADALVAPRGSGAFARESPRPVVWARRFDRLFHEILNEPERAEVLAEIGAWLDVRFPRA
jgi:alpha-beta hydrolase superfamily lysophospholipase